MKTGWHYRPENRERQRETRIRNNHKCREKLFEILGRVCKQCGFADTRALQVDHIYGDGAYERKHKMGHSRYSLLKRVRENPERHQMLCANCNWIKRIENNEQGRRNAQ